MHEGLQFATCTVYKWQSEKPRCSSNDGSPRWFDLQKTHTSGGCRSTISLYFRRIRIPKRSCCPGNKRSSCRYRRTGRFHLPVSSFLGSWRPDRTRNLRSRDNTRTKDLPRGVVKREEPVRMTWHGKLARKRCVRGLCKRSVKPW